jgi:hypothetical protein
MNLVLNLPENVGDMLNNPQVLTILLILALIWLVKKREEERFRVHRRLRRLVSEFGLLQKETHSLLVEMGCEAIWNVKICADEARRLLDLSCPSKAIRLYKRAGRYLTLVGREFRYAGNSGPPGTKLWWVLYWVSGMLCGLIFSAVPAAFIKENWVFALMVAAISAAFATLAYDFLWRYLGASWARDLVEMTRDCQREVVATTTRITGPDRVDS